MALDPEGIGELVKEALRSDFKDRRLQQRLAKIVGKLAAKPTASFPKVFNAAELEGAYRFFGNPAVGSEDILSGHYARMRERCRQARSVLVVHDSTQFAFDPNGSREGLGRIHKAGQAFFGHFTLVLSADGSRNPLGLAALETWVRHDDPAGAEKKRWARGVDVASARLGEAQTMLHVMDREADDYALFAHLVENRHRFLIRLTHDRVLSRELGEASSKISNVLSQVECVIERQTKLSKRIDGSRSPTQKKTHPARSARVAQLAIGAVPLLLPRPRTQPDVAEQLNLTLIRVWEPRPPEGEPAVEWLLITNEPAAGAEELSQLVDAYRARWTIEEFFKALKTGCAYMKRQLEDYESLVNALAVSAPIACRALELRTRARLKPGEADELMLEPDELLVLRLKGRTKLPAQPTNRDILLAVAAMGGHIKWNGDPGWKTICEGLHDLVILTEGYRLAKLQPASDQ
ncbi:MAG: IS4 family transposase [Planctomycetaceae bacterium]|nr:IS4 family transposase [Planctomycetaceae bacterium]